MTSRDVGKVLVFRRKVRAGVLYLEGSDSHLEWLHHVLPFAGLRERREARRIVDWLALEGIMLRAVAGHSLGAAVGSGVAKALGLPLYVYGGKAPPWGAWVEPTAVYRHRGDVVPWLTPWRRGWKSVTLGVWMPFWAAHEPRMYFEQMAADGVR